MHFSAACLDLESMLLSEREKQISCINTYMWNLENMVEMNLSAKQK